MGVRRSQGDTCISGSRTSELQSNSFQKSFPSSVGADWWQPLKDSYPGISRGQAARPLARHRTCACDGRLERWCPCAIAPAAEQSDLIYLWSTYLQSRHEQNPAASPSVGSWGVPVVQMPCQIDSRQIARRRRAGSGNPPATTGSSWPWMALPGQPWAWWSRSWTSHHSGVGGTTGAA